MFIDHQKYCIMKKMIIAEHLGKIVSIKILELMYNSCLIAPNSKSYICILETENLSQDVFWFKKREISFIERIHIEFKLFFHNVEVFNRNYQDNCHLISHKYISHMCSTSFRIYLNITLAIKSRVVSMYKYVFAKKIISYQL